VVRSDDVRTLSFLLKQNKSEFDTFRLTGNLEQAYLNALQKTTKENSNPVQDVFDAIKSCTKALGNMPFKILKDASSKENLFQTLTALDEAVAAIKEP